MYGAASEVVPVAQAGVRGAGCAVLLRQWRGVITFVYNLGNEGEQHLGFVFLRGSIGQTWASERS